MLINREKCISCGRCALYCPVQAIKEMKNYYEVDLDICVECYNCSRQARCPKDALYPQKLVWPRTIRNLMSDVLSVAEESQISGRGTEEMKTNEVTGRFKEGEVGIAVEMGRPSIATNLLDVEKVAMKMAEVELDFESDNPITTLMEDKKTGKFREDVLHERCLSAIIEAKLSLDSLAEVLEKIKEVEDEINTVFSLCVASKLDANGTNPSLKVLDKIGVSYKLNGKTNVGLGRPLAK